MREAADIVGGSSVVSSVVCRVVDVPTVVCESGDGAAVKDCKMPDYTCIEQAEFEALAREGSIPIPDCQGGGLVLEGPVLPTFPHCPGTLSSGKDPVRPPASRALLWGYPTMGTHF